MLSVKTKNKHGLLKTISMQGLRERYSSAQLRAKLSSRSLKFKETSRNTKPVQQPLRPFTEHELIELNESSWIVVSAVLTPQHDNDKPLAKDNLYPALRKVILGYPALGLQVYGPSHNKGTHSPSFVMAKGINLDAHVTVFADTNSETERLRLYEQYSSMWPLHLGGKTQIPPWRLLVFPLGAGDVVQTTADICGPPPSVRSTASIATFRDDPTVEQYEIAIVYSRCLGGIDSGRAVLSALELFLNNSCVCNPGNQLSNIVPVPDNQIVESIEQTARQPRIKPILKRLLSRRVTITDDIWTGAIPITAMSAKVYTPRSTSHRRVRITAATMISITQLCQLRRTSFVALLTAVTLASLSRAVPVGSSDSGTMHTKMQACIRRNRGTPMPSDSLDSMHTVTFLRDELTLCESVEEGGYSTAVEMALLWSAATTIDLELSMEGENGPTKAAAGDGRLSSVEIFNALAESAGMDEEAEWELSSLGALQTSTNAPLAVSYAQFDEGDVLLGFSWSPYNVGNDVVEDVILSISRYIAAVSYRSSNF